MDPTLLQSLKALAEPSRLRILGLLGARAMAADELAAATHLPLSAVVRQLRLLARAGLVEIEAGDPSRFALRVARLSELGRGLDELERDAAAEVSASPLLPGPDGRARPASESRVLSAFFEDGRLTTIPAQERKRLVVLRYLAETVFTEDRPYPEKEVNQLLALVHPDVAALRRYLVDHRFAERAGGVYRRRPVEDWPVIPDEDERGAARRGRGRRAAADRPERGDERERDDERGRDDGAGPGGGREGGGRPEGDAP